MDTLYSIIFDFIHEYIFHDNNGSGDFYLHDFATKVQDVSGNMVSITYQEWLCHTMTIIAMCLIVAFAIWLVRWIFKAVSSAFLLKR